MQRRPGSQRHRLQQTTPTPEERKRCRRDLESLAIYSGLEIDAAKTGVRPNLDEFLSGRKVKRTPFLQYKYLLERAEERRRAWYEPTHRERLDSFFSGIDWDTVDSPVERLPWLARQLERNTPKIQEKPAKDSEIVARDIDGISKSVEVQCQAISAFDKVLRGSQEEQAKFFEKINKLASDLREDFGKRIRIIPKNKPQNCVTLKNLMPRLLSN